MNFTTRFEGDIIPLSPYSKAPPKGFDLDAVFDHPVPLSDMTEFITENSNFGLVMRPSTNGLVVIDVDTPTKIEEYKAKYPTLTVKTPKKNGIHLYYYSGDYPVEGQGHLEELVEYYASNHYMVIPPSVVRFENGSGQYEIVRDLPIAPLPDEYRRMIVSGVSENGQKINTSKYSRVEIKDLVNHLIETGSFMFGQHNDTLFYGSMVMAGDGYSLEAVTKLMLEADRRDPTPQGADKVRSTVQRAFERYAKPREKPEIKQAVEMAVIPVVSKRVFETFTLGDVYDVETEVKWLIKDWLLESSVVMMAAPPERYKTWLSIAMALSVANGFDFAGQFKVEKTGPVLMVQQEDFGPTFIGRVKAVERAMVAQSHTPTVYYKRGDTIYFKPGYTGQDQIHFHTSGMLSLEDNSSLDALEEKIKVIKPILVIVDPFYSIAKVDDFFAGAANKIRERIKDLRNRYGCTFLFIHHTKKSASNPNADSEADNRNDMFGSNLLNAALEGMILVGIAKGTNKEGLIVVRRRFKNAEPMKPVTVQLTIDTHASYDGDAFSIDVAAYEGDETLKKIVKLLDNGPMALKDLYEEVMIIMPDRFSSKPRLTDFLKGKPNVFAQDEKRHYFVKPDGGV